MSIESVMASNHLIRCRPLLLLPSIFPSIRVFSNESALRIRWPKDWSFSFNISPSNEYPGLIPFKMDWLDLLAVQGALKSLLQHHSSKASILQCSKLESFLPGWMNSLSTRFSIEEALKLCWSLFFPPPVILLIGLLLLLLLFLTQEGDKFIVSHRELLVKVSLSHCNPAGWTQQYCRKHFISFYIHLFNDLKDMKYCHFP